MRNCILLLALMLGWGTQLSAQETNPAKPAGYVINGTINGDYTGKVYLAREESLHGAQTVIDSTEVVDGKYHFEGDSVSTIMVHYIKSNDGQITPLFLENGVITIVADAKNFMWATVSGTPNNDLRGLYQMYTHYVQDSTTRTTVVDWKIYGRDLQKEQEEFYRRSRHIEASWLRIQESMVRKYSDQVFAPFLVMFEMVADAKLETLKELRAGFAPELAEHPYTKALDEFIATQSFGVGSVAYDFTLPTKDGEQVSLKDFRGKYVFLDFWASWCAPCIQEMPNVRELNKTYAGDNFVIIGISMDKEKDKDKWLAAIKEHDMKWIQCCDFQEFNGIVPTKYNVHAIPRTVLIDPEGKVIGVNLRGEKLVEEVGKLIKQQ